MNGRTHFSAGAIVAGVIAVMETSTFEFLSFSNTLAEKIPMKTPTDFVCSVACICLGSMLPDIDLPKSTAGSYFSFLSEFINHHFGHRTITHSALIVSFLYLMMNEFLADFSCIFVPLFIGILSHIFLDLFNDAGVRLLWPAAGNFKLAKVRLGTPSEKKIDSILKSIVAPIWTVFALFHIPAISEEVQTFLKK